MYKASKLDDDELYDLYAEDEDITGDDEDITGNDEDSQHVQAKPKEDVFGRQIESSDARKALGLSVIGTLSIQAIALLIILVTNFLFLANRPRGNYVQLADGNVIEVSEESLNYRSPQVIRLFIFDTLNMLFSWNGIKPTGQRKDINETVELDDGILLEDKGRIPTSAFYAGFAFREGLRTTLLGEIAQIVPSGLLVSSGKDGRPIPNRRNQGRIQTVLVIDFLSNPKPIQNGQWEVDVISTLLLLRDGQVGEEITKFNKRLVVVAVDPTIATRGDTLGLFPPLVNIRQSGLQITEIKNLEI